ncbi:MAG: T9SS type A sorting domain-containing protein [Saprospiraceae bacterium]|nr:T9SS type A sorting domain-containing protein [Saprospiraceae bacterium]
MEKRLKLHLNLKILLVFIFMFMLNWAHAQLPPCDPGLGNTLDQINNTPVTVSINSNNCKVLVPDLLSRWVASPGPGFDLISVSQAPSSSEQITMPGGSVCSNDDIEVYIEAIFFYFGDPTNSEDDILCSIVLSDFFDAVDETMPSFVGFGDMTINVTNDCVIDAVDVKLLLKKAHVKDNCTSKDYLVANSWVTPCGQNPPPDPECPEGIQCWTFHIVDACGNEKEQDIDVTVNENVPPVINLPNNFTLNANVDCEITELQLLALVNASHVSDNCTSDATLLANLQVEYGGFECISYLPGEPMVTCPYNPEGVYCYTFTTTDACGNVSNPEVVSIYVKDVTAPVLIAPADFSVCWPDPNYPFQNFTLEPTVIEACDADCDITCIIYSQRILSLTNPPKGAYGNNVYPVINLASGPRLAKVRVCAQDLCGNGALNPPLNAPLPGNCCIFNILLEYDEGCAPPLKDQRDLTDSYNKLERVSQELNHNSTDEDFDLYLGAYPNPFRDQSQIHFNMAQGGMYRVSLVTQTGKVVKILNGFGQQGRNVLGIESRDLEFAGVYFCHVETPSGSQTLILQRSN